MKANPLKYNMSFLHYCTIYSSLIAISGGFPIDTKMLAETIENAEDKYSLYAEYFAFKLTGADDNFQNKITVLCDTIYRPVRAYPWTTNLFTFKLGNQDDIPIAFFNCIENINTNVPYLVDCISENFFKEEYFNRNPDLITLFVLLRFGIMSKDLDKFNIYEHLLPELMEKFDKKEFLFEKIQSMCNPYYKSRALYQLATFYDEKSYELLNQSFILTKNIQESSLKFQVLEKIFSIVHYKEIEQKLFIQQIVDELILTYDNIEDVYNRIIASIRLSFYGSGEFRKKYLTNALETLYQMDENDDKIKLIIKLKPLITIYDDLLIKFNEMIETLKNKMHHYMANAYYGRMLFTETRSIFNSNIIVDLSEDLKNRNDKNNMTDISNYNELQGLFLLFAQLNDIKLVINKTESTDQLWVHLFKDINNPSTIEKILNSGLHDEIFLTPQIAIIIDELMQKGKEDTISILFPYIIKQFNEVLPIVQKWFTQYNNCQIKNLAALLLAEAKHVFEPAVDTIINLLTSDNDQMRYRAQQIFQHPARDVEVPTKRISVLGEKTMIKILEHAVSIIEIMIQSLHPLYIEKLLHSVMHLAKRSQISADDWIEFARLLAITDTSQFKEKLYFLNTDIERIEFILN
ncbi:unnamed protein product, partial [Rotaria sp. Silwood1]